VRIREIRGQDFSVDWQQHAQLVYNRPSMQPARIAELLEPFLSPIPNPCHSEPGQRPGEESALLSSAQLQDISTYIDILLRWNARINLTAIRNEEEIVTRHFGESLFAARYLFPHSSSAPSAFSAVKDLDVAEGQGPTPVAAIAVADIGSGAGFPGIPIKLWAPQIHLTLIESNHKKATFLREITRALTLTNINIHNGRAEQLAAQEAAGFNVVTLRAVEHFASILPVASSLLAPAGHLALLLGQSQQDQAQSIVPNLTWHSPIPIPQSASRILLTAHRP
jgi:16S rRNA (guanine527-N7)-methyltransferase